MELNNKKTKSLKLRLGNHWPSFEKFRTEGAKALESIKEGTVGTLTTKTGQYRIIEEQDFQKMYGLARDVERLRGGLRLITVAVRAAQKHPDSANLEVLAEAVAQLGELPPLPIRDRFEPLKPENLAIDKDDEAILNPDEIERPFETETNSEKEGSNQ